MFPTADRRIVIPDFSVPSPVYTPRSRGRVSLCVFGQWLPLLFASSLLLAGLVLLPCHRTMTLPLLSFDAPFLKILLLRSPRMGTDARNATIIRHSRPVGLKGSSDWVPCIPLRGTIREKNGTHPFLPSRRNLFAHFFCSLSSRVLLS